MTDPSQTNEPDDRDVHELLRAAGRRREAPEAMRERVYANALAMWEETEADVQPHRRSNVPAWLAAAATIVLGIAVAWFSLQQQPSEQALPAIAGTVLATQGGYEVRGDLPANGKAIPPGAMLQTQADGQMLVQLHPAVTLRLAEDTHVTIAKQDRLWLHRGKIYVDSQRKQPGAIKVLSDSGVEITDIGTQFEVTVANPSELRLAVRQGSVHMTLGENNISARASDGIGELLGVTAQEVQYSQSLATTDPHWTWVTQLPTPFEKDGATWDAYLRWVARETGRELRYQTPEAEVLANQEQVRGRADPTTDLTLFSGELNTAGLGLVSAVQHELVVNIVN